MSPGSLSSAQDAIEREQDGAVVGSLSWAADIFVRADEILARPPARPHLRRVPPIGSLVQRFAIPLDLCKPQNRTRHGQAWVLGKLKRDLWGVMVKQAARIRKTPLPGRPFVRCIRFSNTEPDKYSDWAKQAVDRLCLPTKRRKNGLGLLRDDRPADAEIHQQWEYVPRGEGFVVIEVWTGDCALIEIVAGAKGKP